MVDPLHILLLCDDRRDHANTVREHIAAFRRWSRHRIRTFDPRGLPGRLSPDLDRFDVVVIHYSIFVMLEEHVAASFQEKLTRFQGLKVQFVQDEYHRVDDLGAVMRRLGIRVLFTAVPREEWPRIWSETRLPGVLRVPTLTGYVPDGLGSRRTPPLEARTIDIGYRGREVPWWLGDLGQEKVRIGQGLLARAESYGLRCDIAWTEDSRIYGEDWIKFISSCRAVLGTESGASITDFDGSVERAVARYRWEHPTADFEEVHREVLAPFEGNARVIAISPRMFEAAALRTAMVLFPGRYSGILKPGTHYIPLEKDFSNMDEVVNKLKNLDSLRALVERAYADLVSSGRYSYQAFVREFDDVMDANAWPHRRGVEVRFGLAQAEAVFRRKILERFLRLSRLLPPALLAFRLTLRDAGLRAILLSYLRDSQVRGLTSATELMIDLLRFDVLMRTTGANCQVVVAFEPDQGRLGFVSRPGGAAEAAELTPSCGVNGAIESTLKAGRLTAITWNHSLLNQSLRRRGARVTGLGSDDTHRFKAFERLAAHSPEKIWRILRPLLSAASTSGPGRTGRGPGSGLESKGASS